MREQGIREIEAQRKVWKKIRVGEKGSGERKRRRKGVRKVEGGRGGTE